MLVDSTRFGSFEVDPARTLHFAEPLLGFPTSTRYVIVEVEDSPYFWLQSAEEPEVAFLAVSPFLFFPSYDLELGDEEQQALEISSPEQAEVMTLLTIHRTGATAQSITANLLGPIVVNIETRSARQVVLQTDEYSTREPLAV